MFIPSHSYSDTNIRHVEGTRPSADREPSSNARSTSAAKPSGRYKSPAPNAGSRSDAPISHKTLAAYPDHLEVVVDGVSTINVLLSEVGLKESQNVRVGGPKKPISTGGYGRGQRRRRSPLSTGRCLETPTGR